MHHDKFVFCIAVVGACILQIWAENPMQNAEVADKRAWNSFQGSYGKRAWNHFNGGYGKRAWNHFNGGYGKRAWNNQFLGKRNVDEDEMADDYYIDDVSDLERNDKRAWNSGFAGGIGKRAWNSGFAGAIGKRAWNSGFASGLGKRAWNSGFAGGIGKRAWNSGFQGAVGKRSEMEDEEEEELEQLAPAEKLTAIKRNWHSVGVRGSWGKRSSSQSAPKYFIMSQDDYNSKKQEYMNDNLAKRTKGWIALRGMWGKRSDPEMTTSSNLLDEDHEEDLNHGLSKEKETN